MGTTIADILNSQAGSYDTTTTSSNDAMGKEAFLQLLTAQLTNQDPLSPMENEQFVAQLAQFSNLEQMIAVNERLESMAMTQLSQSSASAVNFIGKDVRAMADWVDYDGVNATDVNFELLGTAAETNLTIEDEDGNVVRTVQLGQRSDGSHSWEWDGLNNNGEQVDAGTYTVTLTAKDESGTNVNGYTESLARVTGISYESGYAELMLGDHRISLADVVEVLED